ncbi:MAG: RNA polymerase sigma factor [Dehalococcoidia bacterium]|nr:RNA polymerase sigma factor [Dehalococcoidia bacterium]
MSEDLTIAKCQDGDREAFRVLVDRHKDVLYGTALLMTGNRAVAEEAVQEAFLSAWRGISGFRRGRPLKPWLTRILVNGVLATKRKKAVPTVPIVESGGNGAPSISDQTDAIESRLVLRQALDKLDEEQKRIVVLRYFAELTVPEIAETTGTREGTVKSRLHRALAKLREHLEEFGEGDDEQ